VNFFAILGCGTVRHTLATSHDKFCGPKFSENEVFRTLRPIAPYSKLDSGSQKNIGIVSYIFLLQFTEITGECGDRPRQPVHEIKLMLSLVSWALAQISCLLSLALTSAMWLWQQAAGVVDCEKFVDYFHSTISGERKSKNAVCYITFY